ncbi:MAG TPA: radical SAM protein [Anaerolineae bacterium]|nr:radical SAM protein [Anaerolineae bacterium]
MEALITSKPTLWAEVNAQGDLVIPREVAERFGLQPGARARLEDDANHVRLHRPVTQLTKVYIEPTTCCNLDCRTCIRNVWNAELSSMKPATYACILDNLKTIEPRPRVFFGGLGEPLLHKHIVDWIEQAKAIGATVELITNGTLLTEERARALIASGLDNLWISIDGATPESYADVRLGAQLPHVIENVKRLRRLRKGSHFAKPEIDVAFVAMKRNIHELPDVLKLARSLDARQFKVSNVLPYTQELWNEILYAQEFRDLTYMPSRRIPRLSLPKIGFSDDTSAPLFKALHSGYNVSLAGNNLGGANDVCEFIESGSISIGWDGSVAPCLPLLHTHAHYFKNWQHEVKEHILGNINKGNLLDLWLEPEYVHYRERVHSFAFAPCTACGGCELLDANEEDCLGNAFPSCGCCLWAQGLIQCP